MGTWGVEEEGGVGMSYYCGLCVGGWVGRYEEGEEGWVGGWVGG